MTLIIFVTGKDPVPIRCPVAGAFNFTQAGDFPFKTRILGGITKDPRHDVWGRTGQFSCKQNISRLAVCDTGIHIIHLSTIKFLSLYNSDLNFIPIFFFIFQIKKRSQLMKHIAGQQTI